MIIVSEKNIFSAYKKSFLLLYEKGELSHDPELWREDFACITVDNELLFPRNNDLKGKDANWIFASFTEFKYEEYFPYIKKEIINRELSIWPTEFISRYKLFGVIKYFKRFPVSKRVIVNLWSDKFRNPNILAPCLTQMSFRKKGSSLEMHSHLRANNASFLLFLDMQILLRVQQFIAWKLNLSQGKYIHLVDSFHFYKNEFKEVKKHRDFIQKSEVWRNY